MTLAELQQFRSCGYTILGNAKDALFDLIDAVLVTRSVYSFVELSLFPVFRRKWSSIYEAVADSKPPREALMRRYIEQLPQTEPIVLAGEHTAWSRLEAVTLKERTFEHLAQPMSGAQPVTVGQGYSTGCALSPGCSIRATTRSRLAPRSQRQLGITTIT